MKIAAIRSPRYGEERRNIMKDLCASVGATFISREQGTTLKEVKLNDFGQAKSINVTKGWTTIVGGKGDWEEIDTRLLRSKMRSSKQRISKSVKGYKRELLVLRLESLSLELVLQLKLR
jgi:chaperonin GroEL